MEDVGLVLYGEIKRSLIVGLILLRRLFETYALRVCPNVDNRHCSDKEKEGERDICCWYCYEQ